MTNNETTIKTTISDLPDDCLREILLKIPVTTILGETRVRLRAVCKRWAAIIDDCWRETKELTLSNMPVDNIPHGYHADEKFMKILDKFLSSTVIHNFSNNKLVVVTAKLKSIQGFMNHCGPFLISLVEQRNGSHVFPIMSLAIEKCHKLEKFSGFVESKTDGKQLRELLIACKKLKSLKIHMECGNVYSFFQKIPTHQLESLTIFINRIQDRRLPKYIKATIRNCQVLKKLQTDYMDDELVELITGLNELHLGYAGRNHLVIYNPSILIKDEHLISLSKTCLQLTTIKLQECPNITDAGVSALSSLPKLKTLHLLNLVRITGTCIKDFSTIDELDVTKSFEIKDADVIGLLKNSQTLRSLKLDSCKNITDKTLTVAVQETKKRNNNIVLTISCLGTKAKPEKFKNASPLLEFTKSLLDKLN